MTNQKQKNKKMPRPFEGEPSLSEKLHFERIAQEISQMPWQISGHSPTASNQAPLIGTLREKRLHAIVKRYLSEDVSTHEIPMKALFQHGDDPRKKRNIVADVLVDNHIYEVQTGGFYPLIPKLQWYLDHTDYRITVVHPMAGMKYLSWIDPTNGQVVSRNKRNKRGQVKDIAGELYWLTKFISNPRFSLRLLLLEIEEFRILDGYGKEKKNRATHYERFPTALLGDVRLYEAEDYAFYFLPESLRHAPFTAADYAKATGIRGKASYSLLHLMTGLGLLEEGEKIGRSMSFSASALVASCPSRQSQPSIG